jgi:hypothetical protein
VPAEHKVLQVLPKPLRKSARWLTIGAGAALLLTWNGRLVISTGAGLGTIWLAYSMREWGWRAVITDLVNTLEGVDRRITLSILAGAGATFGTYTALSIWLEAQSHWLATGMILQGTITIGALGILLWQRFQLSPDQSGLMQHISDLTHDDPLKRLIAVRHINQLLPKHPRQTADIAEFYQVLLTREPDHLVREAVMDGLQQIAAQPSMPPATTKSFQPRNREPVSSVSAQPYVEPEAMFLPIEDADQAADQAMAHAADFEYL